MAELKTKATTASVEEFLDAIPDEQRREDCYAISKIMQRATGKKPVMWGPSIVGFGNFTYKYPGGKEMAWFPIGFSPRKNDLTLYLMGGGLHLQKERLQRLGKHKTGVGCLYIKRLADVDVAVLTEMVAAALTDLDQVIEEKKKAANK